jgi:hypothetical protein
VDRSCPDVEGDRGHVGVSIFTVTNLVRDGCRDHRPADPLAGPSVDDLAALADLAPFKVTSPPRDVTAFGYRGKHLELTAPDLSPEGKGLESGFTECVDGNLKSWIAPTAGAFYGYTGPGYSDSPRRGRRVPAGAQRARARGLRKMTPQRRALGYGETATSLRWMGERPERSRWGGA